jgi:hypothetical protein
LIFQLPFTISANNVTFFSFSLFHNFFLIDIFGCFATVCFPFDQIHHPIILSHTQPISPPFMLIAVK